MDRALIVIALSLFAGAAGGAGAQLLLNASDTGAATEAPDNTKVLAALRRIEKQLDGEEATGLEVPDASDPVLERVLAQLERMEARSSAPRLMPADGERPAPAGANAELLQRIEDAIGVAMEEKLKSWKEAEAVEVTAKAKKKVSFQEMANELELTADEQDKLRAVLKDTETKALKLLVDEGQDVEDLRRELKEKGRTPEGRAEMRGKLMTKFVSNMGGFIGLMIGHQTAVTGAVGPAKAKRIENDFRVSDPDLIDFDMFELD